MGHVDVLCRSGVEAADGRLPVRVGIGHSTRVAARLAALAGVRRGA